MPIIFVVLASQFKIFNMEAIRKGLPPNYVQLGGQRYTVNRIICAIATVMCFSFLIHWMPRPFLFFKSMRQPERAQILMIGVLVIDCTLFFLVKSWGRGFERIFSSKREMYCVIEAKGSWYVLTTHYKMVCVGVAWDFWNTVISSFILWAFLGGVHLL